MIKKTSLMFSLALSPFALHGCTTLFPQLTPMPEPEKQALTTCKTGNLETIRKNLMLAGYDVTNFSKEAMATGYKQVDAGYNSGKVFRKINVVSIDPKTARFVVKNRQENYREVSAGSTTYSGGYTAQHSQVVRDENEFDEKYYSEYRDQYVGLQTQVCGSSNT
jgi:hypothetical protein